MFATANKLTTALALAILLGATSSASAAVITYAEYTFEGAAGSAASALDVSGNGRDYVNVISGNTYDAETRPGSEGSTSVLFANGGFYGMNNIPGGVLPTNDIGFEGWFKATNASEGNVHIFGISSNDNGMSIAQNGAAWSGLHGGVAWLSPTYPLDTSEWVHLAVVRDNGLTRFYANGELITTNGGGLSGSLSVPHLAVNGGGAVRYDGKADDLRIFTFNPGGGQFSQSDLNTLDNLVLGGTASQSTSHPAGPAGNGIDQNLGNFTHTLAGDANPWWQVVMPENGVIDQVVLNNRGDGCCPERLRDIFVDVLNQGGDVVWTSLELNDGNSLGSPRVIRLDVPDYVRGKTVRVRRIPQAPGNNDDLSVLALGEVQALGRTIYNVAEGKPATQSSNYSSTSYLAGNGTNGNFGDFTHTAGGDQNPWWQVDLADGVALDFDIESVVLHNRDDCCGGRLRDLTLEVLDFKGNLVFTSDVLNPENAMGGGVGDFVNGPAFIEVDLLALFGDTVRGRFVRIARAGLGGGDNGNVLALGEVQVFGVAAVPEPATLALAGLGLLGIVFWRRRERAGRS